MKNVLTMLAVLSAYLAMPSCTPSNVTPMPDGAVPAGCASACAAAQQAGCPEGQFADCAATCNKVMQDPGMPHPNTLCLSSAKTQEAVRSCGWSCNVSGGK